MCLVQETKSTDAQFPADSFPGYEIAHFGLNQWNGVAILSKVGLEGVEKQFPGQPGFHKDPAQPQELEARAISAICGGVRVWSVYPMVAILPIGITTTNCGFYTRWLNTWKTPLAP